MERRGHLKPGLHHARLQRLTFSPGTTTLRRQPESPRSESPETPGVQPPQTRTQCVGRLATPPWAELNGNGTRRPHRPPTVILTSSTPQSGRQSLTFASPARSQCGRRVSSRRSGQGIKTQSTNCPPGCRWGPLRSQRRPGLLITARRAAAMVGDLVVAVVADAAPEQDVLCRADAGGDGVPDRGPRGNLHRAGYTGRS